MRAKIRYAIPARHARSIGFRNANAAIFHRSTDRGLAMLGIALIFLMLSVGVVWAASQDNQPNDSLIKKLDSRWLPWIGSWSLISNITNRGEAVEVSNNTLEIKPGIDGKSVAMKGSQDEKVLYEEKNVVVDGVRRRITDDSCKGWYMYSWSDTGKRLLFDSEAVCADNRSRTISGISTFTDPSEWVDIQLLTSGEDRMITIRRYRQKSGDQDNAIARSTSHFARVAAGANFSIEEIIELTDKAAPEVMEAALMEMRKPFEINSKVLLRLDKAGVPSQVVDLMVALSFPKQFTIERREVEPVEKPASRGYSAPIVYPYAWSPFGMWSYYDLFFPGYWSTPWYMYGYWGWGGYYPIYWGPSGPGGGYSISGGRLIAGEGYSRVTPGSPGRQPRYAKSRGGSNTVTRAGSSGSGRTGAYSSGSYSGGSSAGSSSGRSGGGSPSASPGGYSSGGGGGGRAHGR